MLKTTLCLVAVLRTSVIGFGEQATRVEVEIGQEPPVLQVEIPNKPILGEKGEITGYTDEPDISDNLRLIKKLEKIEDAPALRPEGLPDNAVQTPNGWIVPSEAADGSWVPWRNSPLQESAAPAVQTPAGLASPQVLKPDAPPALLDGVKEDFATMPGAALTERLTAAGVAVDADALAAEKAKLDAAGQPSTPKMVLVSLAEANRDALTRDTATRETEKP